jgi:RNA recognition motif-containing protein
MSKKLYVGGLSWDTSEDNLREAFKECGEVLETKIIMDRYSGRSRGFGFVTFTNNEDAQKAITQKDGTALDGRTLSVSEAREDPNRQGGNRDRNYGGGSYRRY